PSGGPATLQPATNGGQEKGDDFAKTGIVPPDDEQAAAGAAPSWTASSSGSVGCLAGSFFVHVSLEDQAPMDPEALSFAGPAKGPNKTGSALLSDTASRFLIFRFGTPREL